MPAAMDLLRTIDRVLRGQFTRPQELSSGRVEAPTTVIVVAALALGALYGLFMGLFALLTPGRSGFDQWLATVVKVPLLFLLTLLVTYPSLYVVSALFDSRLRFVETLRLLVLALLVNLALLASFGPVTGFFTLSTESYPFMVLLNVVFFAVSGFVGLAFLRRALAGVFGARDAEPGAARETREMTPVETAGTAGEAAEREDAGQRDDAGEWEDAGSNAPHRVTHVIVRGPARVPPTAERVFRVWIVIYAVVGAQMGWILRPFIGSPDLPFQLLRERDSNFFEAVLEALRRLTA